MEEFLKTVLIDTSGGVAYATIFGVLLACGLGIPLPEDLSLIMGGYLAHLEAVKLPYMMAVGFAGILAGDTLIFMAGRRVGNSVDQRKGLIARIVTPEKRAKVSGLFQRHGEKIVMIARFMPGVRAVTYFTAGASGMKYSHFIFWDGLAAMGSAPLFVFLGYHFGEDLEALIDKLKAGQFTVLAGLGMLIVAYLGYRWWSKRREKRQLAAEQVAVSEPRVEKPVAPPAARDQVPSPK
ncbi:MAG: DedA family protein [Myxococcaceae bacterium]